MAPPSPTCPTCCRGPLKESPLGRVEQRRLHDCSDCSAAALHPLTALNGAGTNNAVLFSGLNDFRGKCGTIVGRVGLPRGRVPLQREIELKPTKRPLRLRKQTSVPRPPGEREINCSKIV